jgi:hypothetical protein
MVSWLSFADVVDAVLLVAVGDDELAEGLVLRNASLLPTSLRASV